MLYREIIVVCSQIYRKHINTVCGQNVELANVKLSVHIVTLGFGKLFTQPLSITCNIRTSLKSYEIYTVYRICRVVCVLTAVFKKGELKRIGPCIILIFE